MMAVYRCDACVNRAHTECRDPDCECDMADLPAGCSGTCEADNAIRALHTKTLLSMFFDSDCATEDCDHNRSPIGTADCPTYPLEVCAHCNRIAEDAELYGGLSNVPKLAHWPCATIQAIDAVLVAVNGREQ